VNYGDSLDGCLSVQTRETCDDGEPHADFNLRPGAPHVNYGDSLDGFISDQMRETCDDGEPLAEFYVRPGARHVNCGNSLDEYYFRPRAQNMYVDEALITSMKHL
jgi:hypothetical protein